VPSVPSTSNQAYVPLPSTTPASISSLEVGNEFTETESKHHVTLSPQICSSSWSTKLGTTKKGLMSKRHSVWHLPPSYDLENLRGVSGPLNPTIPSSPAITSSSILPQ
jgi:hypothetical protein